MVTRQELTANFFKFPLRPALGNDIVSLMLGFPTRLVPQGMQNDFTGIFLRERTKKNFVTYKNIPAHTAQYNRAIHAAKCKPASVWVTDAIVGEANLFAFLKFAKTKKRFKDQTLLIVYSDPNRKHFVNLMVNLKEKKLIAIDPQTNAKPFSNNLFFTSETAKRELNDLDITNRGTVVYNAQHVFDDSTCGYFASACTIALLRDTKYLQMATAPDKNLEIFADNLYKEVNYNTLSWADELSNAARELRDVTVAAGDGKILLRENSVERSSSEDSVASESVAIVRSSSEDSVASDNQSTLIAIDDEFFEGKSSASLDDFGGSATLTTKEKLLAQIDTECAKAKNLQAIFQLYDQLKNETGVYAPLREERGYATKALGALGLFSKGNTHSYQEAMQIVKATLMQIAKHLQTQQIILSTDDKNKMYQILQTQTGHVSSLGDTTAYKYYKDLAKAGKVPDLSACEYNAKLLAR